MSPKFPGPSGGKWSQTTLWSLLSQSQKPEDEPLLNFLQRWMPRIETILRSAGTSPHAFTLHDADHSFRVAQRIAEVIPADVLPRLASYELALLLLAAYLHDIGMTPEEQKVISHYNYLLTGDRGSLTENDIEEFQQWLDDDERGLTPPLLKGKVTAEHLHLAAELVTYYSRYRHNDWSEKWIRKTFGSEPLGTYSGWLGDLILLCKSHHFAKADLLGAEFDPRLVGSPAVVVHLRYLACALRVADILDFDPERTPEVVLRHREIPAESLIHWYKNHAIAMTRDGSALALTARPTSAKLHRAIELMCDDIDHELQTCRSIADETHFQSCPNLDLKLPHRWDLQHAIRRDLKAKEDAYEYIDGAFRPNTRKLLQLFAGTQLYIEPLAAVRELVQNAFDAVRESIAYKRLASSDPLDDEVEAAIRKLHRVELELETRPDGTWLVCQDNGVGMTRSIIIHHLLVSGRARRHDILKLARRCQEAGFTLDRTGQFGIGVLSYFMIANRVIISTRRTLEPGDADETGWRFETEGIGSFGELRRGIKVSPGCRIELRLKEEGVPDPIQWFAKLREYLKYNVRFAPCELRLSGALPGCEPLVIPIGWTHTSDDFRSGLSRDLYEGDREKIPSELLPKVDRQQREEIQKHVTEIRSELETLLRWTVTSGKLPKGMGSYRLHLPHFSLDGGACLAFLRIRQRNGQVTLGSLKGGLCVLPDRGVHLSWKGMLVKSDDHEFASWFQRGYERDDVRPTVEIDFTSNHAGELSVNRADFSIKHGAKEAGQWLRELAAKFTRDFAVSRAESSFAIINRRLSGAENLSITDAKWIALQNPDDDAVWQGISFPATTSLPWAYRKIPDESLWDDKQVQILCGLRSIAQRDHYEGPAFVLDTPPDKVVSIEDDRYWEKIVGPLWLQNPFTRPKKSWRMTCQFPPEWPNLCGVHFDHYGGRQIPGVVWNTNHVVVQSVDEDSWNWARHTAARQIDPLTFKTDLLSDRKKAAAWILLSLLRVEREIWLGLLERDAKFVTALWEFLFRNDGLVPYPTSLCLWFQEVAFPKLYEVSLSGAVEEYRNRATIERHMPKTEADWCIKTIRHTRRR